MEKIQFKIVIIALLVFCLTVASTPVFAARSDVEDFVTRFYQQCLDRSPDAAGLDYWVDLLMEGRYSGAEVAQGFVLSQEFINSGTTDSEFLDILYRAFFNREPDDGGKNYWLTQLQSLSREQVLSGFTNATEFDNLCDTYNISPVTTPVKEFVGRFYQYCFGREADTSGLNYWANHLIDGTKTGADVAQGFVFSQEFLNADTTDDQFVTVLYNAFFGREPDDGGKTYWLAQLTAGNSRSQVLDGFIYATEFNNLCANYDIDPNADAAVRALNMPDRITLSKVDSSQDESRSLLRKLGTRAYSDEGTDYSEAQKSIWIDDTEALEMVNDILGVVQDSGYEHFVNKGAYKALVKKISDEVQSQSGSSSTSSTTEELMEITLVVTREDNNAPMIVKVWVDEEEEEGGFSMKQRIRGYFEVTEGVSSTYPYGKMTAHFKGNMIVGGQEVEPPAFTLALQIDADESGNVIIEFLDSGNIAPEGLNFVDQWEDYARIVTNSTLSAGVAYLSIYEYFQDPYGGSDEEDISSLVVYDENYYKEDDLDSQGNLVGDPEVLDKNSLLTKIYRYRLFYESTGSKVTLNSGFPILLESGENAYIGYYGLWAPESANVQSGDSVTRFGSENQYTVFKVGGKLRKHTKTQIQVSELAGLDMSYWLCIEGNCNDAIVTWDATSEVFKKIGTRNQSTGQIDYLPVESQTEVTFNEWDGAWCQALNSFLPLGRLYKDDQGNSTTPGNSDILYFHSEQTVVPTSDMTFYYWGPAPGESQDTYWSNPQNQTEKTYTFDASEMVLLDENSQAILDTSSEFGLNLSPLTTTQYSQENNFQAYNADVYYTWETGANEWNQFTTLKDSQGNLLTFDPPLQFAYTHATANDLNGDSTFDGKKFNIDYDGFELHMPWKFDDEEGEWQPMINLKDGVVLEDSDGARYVVKGTEGCMLMETVADTSVADYLQFQDVDPPTLTYDATKTALVGALPTGTEVKIIKGELVEN